MWMAPHDLFSSCSILCLVTQSHLTLWSPWIVVHQAPLSMGFSRQEYWSGLPCPPPGEHPNPGIKPRSPALQDLSHQGSPRIACPFSRGPSWPRSQIRVSCITGRFLTSWTTRDAPFLHTHAVKVQLWSCSLFQTLPQISKYHEESRRSSVVTQSCPTLCKPVHCSLPGSSVHGILQKRTLSGLPFPSSQLRDWTQSPTLQAGSLPFEPPWHVYIIIIKSTNINIGLPWWISGKESTYQCRRHNAGRSPGEGNSSSFEYSCLGNPRDKEAWQATVHGVAKESDMTLNNNKASIFKGLSLLHPNLQPRFPL